MKKYILKFFIAAALCGVLFGSCDHVKSETSLSLGEAAVTTEATASTAAAEEVIPPLSPASNTEEEDIILRAYRDPAMMEHVLAFFQGITNSREIAQVILFNASSHDIPPALAFSLCREESAYNPGALNHNKNGTMDRGLFQLNSASFPKLAADEFFDPEVNVRHGLAHLRWCLNTAGTEVAALAMYNAGATRVRSTGTPKSTLDYVSRILKRQRKIEELFTAEYNRIVQETSAEEEQVEKVSFRLSLLTPLGRK